MCPPWLVGVGGEVAGAMCVPRLELSREARLVEIDAVAAHWDAFCEQQLALRLPLGNCSVGAHDAVPGKIVIGREDTSDEAWGARVDVAVGANVALRDRADTLDHELGARGINVHPTRKVS